MESTVKQRLIKYIKYKNLSQGKFEKAIGAGNGFVNNISKSIGAEKLQSILSNFPDLDTEWLLYGKSNMIREEQKNQISQEVNLDTDVRMPREVFDQLIEMTKAITSQQEALTSQQETIASQQRLIESMNTKQQELGNVQEDDDVKCAGAV